MLSVLATLPCNEQAYVNIVSSSAIPTAITTTADVTSGTGCTTTSFLLGNIWYVIGSGAFFFTYNKEVRTSAVVILHTLTLILFTLEVSIPTDLSTGPTQ